jgi:hypothetical protein
MSDASQAPALLTRTSAVPPPGRLRPDPHAFRRVPEVALDEFDTLAEPVGGGLCGVFVVAVVQQHVRALAVERDCGRPADAAGGAGDQDGLPGQHSGAHATACAPVISMTDPQM